MKDTTRAKLTAVSTATLTTVLFKRGFRNVFLSLQPLDPDAPNMVGPAYTLRTIPAREDLDHAIAGGYTPSDPDGLDLEPVRDRWRRVLDIKPTDGAAHEAYRLKASAYDVPELLHEIGRLRELVDPAPNPWKVRTWAVANGYGAACPDGQPVPDYLTTMYRAAHRRRG